MKLAWNVSCALIPVQETPVEIRWFIQVVLCLWSFPEIRVAMEFPRNQSGTPLRWDDALKPLDWRTLPSMGEPEPTPLKNNNN